MGVYLNLKVSGFMLTYFANKYDITGSDEYIGNKQRV